MSDVPAVPRDGLPPRFTYWRTLSRRQYVHLAGNPDFAVYSNPPVGEVVSVRGADGTRIHVEVFGAPDAPPIVLAHGITCAIPFRIHRISALSGEFRVRSDHLSLAELTVPTTVVASAGDLLTPVCHAEAMAAELPCLGNLVVTPGGHCSPLEQPQVITKILRDVGREHAIH